MDKIDDELKYQMSGYVSDETALSICRRLGAQAIAFGQLQELDNKYNLQVKMLDVETGSYILFRVYTFSRSSKSEQLLGRAANYLKLSLGLLLGINKNSIDAVAPEAGLSFDYTVLRRLALGLKAMLSADVFNRENEIYTFEPLGFLKFYLTSPQGEPGTGFFIEGDFGISVIFLNDSSHVAFNCGAAIGYKHAFGFFYLEPALRLGYPYIFGAGLSAGFRF